MSPARPDEIDPAAVEDARQAGAVLVDVREPDECARGRASGAVHLPLGQLPPRIEDLPTASSCSSATAACVRSKRPSWPSRRGVRRGACVAAPMPGPRPGSRSSDKAARSTGRRRLLSCQ
jgi:hypothetical protein